MTDSNRTCSRRFAAQYPASSPAPSLTWPVTADQNGIRPVPGTTPASSPAITAVTGSTAGPCEA